MGGAALASGGQRRKHHSLGPATANFTRREDQRHCPRCSASKWRKPRFLQPGGTGHLSPRRFGLEIQASWLQAREAIVESRGTIDVVSDEEILGNAAWLAQHEGIFVVSATPGPFQMLRVRPCSILVPRNPGRQQDCLHGHRTYGFERSGCGSSANERIEAGRPQKVPRDWTVAKTACHISSESRDIPRTYL